MLEVKEIFRLLGFFLVFLFPLVVVYLTGGPDKEPLLDDDEYERRKRLAQQAETTGKKNKKKSNKKKQQQKNTSIQEEEAPKKPQTNQKKQQKQQQQQKNKTAIKTSVEQQDKVQEPKQEPIVEGKVKEIDEHMDPTVNYARVMRIRPEEEEEEWEAVPYEEGWNQVKSRRPATTNTSKSSSYVDNNAKLSEATSRYIPGLDKKQRENMARNAKKKQQKAAADVLQAERLRKHQKELEKAKIQEFYSKGKGKNTPWGKNGQRSSKIPDSHATFNEYGQLIWE